MNDNIHNLFSFYRTAGKTSGVSFYETSKFTAVKGNQGSWPQMVFDIELSGNPAICLREALTESLNNGYPGLAVCKATSFTQDDQEKLRHYKIYPVEMWTMMEKTSKKTSFSRKAKKNKMKELNDNQELSSFESLINTGPLKSVKMNDTLLKELNINPDISYFGLFAGNELSSGLLSFAQQNVAGLYFTVTKKEYRGEGLAGKLINHVVNILFERGIEKVILQGVQKAVPLYTRLGFIPSGKLIIFWKNIL